jgi:hypothetical protein
MYVGTKLIYQKLQGLKFQITEGFIKVFHLWMLCIDW